MKKVLLLTLALGFSFSLFAQKANLSEDVKNYSVKVSASDLVHDMGSNTSSDMMPYSNNRFSIEDTQIGQTQYDLQSNAALSNRVFRYEDESMVHVWTMGLEGAPNFDGRGAGYNYFDGSDWAPMPESRVEDERCGWPFYAPHGENGEMLVSHTSSGLKLSYRADKFTGDWEYSMLMGPSEAPGLTWPKVASSGENHQYLHIVANSYDPYEGQDAALLYSRTTDAGATWMDENIILPGLGSDDIDQINADDYILETKGDVVALITTGSFNDLVLMKSDDNGDNWVKTVIWANPYNGIPLNDIITSDTMYACDGSLAAEIDSEGQVHVAFGLTRYLKEEEGTTWSYFPYTDGIVYWNESMDPFEADNQHDALSYDNLVENETLVAWTPDIDNNGTIDIGDGELFSYRTGGMATQVSMQMDQDNDIALVYTVPREDLSSGTFKYRHVYGRQRVGTTWGDAFDITGGELHLFDECIYPQVANILPGDEYIHLFYQKDNTPGLALDEDHDWVTNSIIYTKVSMDEFGTISNESDINVASENVVSQNYPNPFNATSLVDVEIAESANLSMEVVNLVGQTVQRVDKGYVPAGTHTMEIKGTNLETGVYFYNVNINDETITKKMVIK